MNKAEASDLTRLRINKSRLRSYLILIRAAESASLKICILMITT